jgi:cysteinyl-tRNA synthetase
VSITLYNSRTRKKESFHPIDPNQVKMYVCGPTVYDFAHIGNARPVVVFDVLYRLLKQTYGNVSYVRNVTDVDDKIIQAAHNKNITIDELTTTTLAYFQCDMKALNALDPDHEPKATEHIPQMIDLVQCLLDKDFAYVSHGHVLFAVHKYGDYGKLAQKNQDDLIAGARVEKANYKKNDADFVLWKPSINNEPGWESPWGYGRPGWHLECSAMSHHYLGDTFDIHGGGIDLIFPHHENEVAQSCCGYDTNIMANFWLHNGHLTVDGEKMSKSLGNFKTVRELLKKYHSEVIRLALLYSHYRQPLDFSDTVLQEVQNTLSKFYRALKNFDHVNPGFCPQMKAALEDDLNTPRMLSIMYEYLADLNTTGSNKAAAYLKGGGVLLGIFNATFEEWFQKKENQNLSVIEIETCINNRKIARDNKDFKSSDEIRDFLKKNGIILDDSPTGTTWRSV